jgi:16S rRNA (guanine966-N2)-methyltransferase
VRVIAGMAKGRPLIVPRGVEVRPTTDRVREAIFSMLSAECMRRTAQAQAAGGFCFERVLDLFAGTGALGIEALSRGAQFVDFVESNARARAAIATNLSRTGFEARGTIHAVTVDRAVSTFRGPYDLILLDPPYSDPATCMVLEALGRFPILSPGAIVVFEHARSLVVPSSVGALQLSRTRHHGTTSVSLLEPVADPAAGDRLKDTGPQKEADV